jgi:hypothetical protein
MRRASLLLASAALAAATIGFTAPAGAGSVLKVPRWVKHVQNYPGGISNGVRAYLDSGLIQAQAKYAASSGIAPRGFGGPNVQMNADSDPPVPQNETAVAYSLVNPMVAVAAANDYISGGNIVMYTKNGGQSWKTTRVNPQFAGTRDFCTGGDPAVAYSLRDRAFYMTQLCFFRSLPFSEIHLFKSIDNGKTWSPGRFASIVATNFDYNTFEVDDSVFHDKEYLTIDNYPHNLHYGRIYVTWTKFHIQPDGFSDYCPIQLAYTDNVPTEDPTLAVWSHTAVQPDNPGGDGTGLSANQFSVPVVEKAAFGANGPLDIAFVTEECNTSIDHDLLFQRSTDGGATFLPEAIKVDKPGQWADNPDPSDHLPTKLFRAPNTVSLAWSEVSGTLAYMYTNYKNMAKTGGDIAVSLSDDGGATWSDSQNVSVRPNGKAALQDQFFPWIAVNPSGTFYAIWLDCRRDPNNHRINTFQASSADDGATWPNVRISTADWDPDDGFFKSASFIGDYSGLAASDEVVYPVWTDGRDSAIDRTGYGETDIFTTVEILG